MRIVGGRLGGRRLAAVPRQGLRPTADPVREALFNILGSRVRGRPFVDLCAGTGAVGLEALSRGAEPVLFVEQSRASLKVLTRNLALLGLDSSVGASRIVQEEVGKWLEHPRGLPASPVEVVFLDPPYGERRKVRWLDRLLASGDWLGSEALIVVEHRSGDPPHSPIAEPCWSRRYGDTTLTAWER